MERMFRLQACALSLGLLSAAFGHEGAHPRIAQLTEDIARAPERLDPYLARGRQYLLIGHVDAALADIEVVSASGGPLSTAADIAAAEALLIQGESDSALHRIDAVIGRAPDNADAWLMRGRILIASGAPGEAARSLSVGLEHAATRRPDDILACARAYRAADDLMSAHQTLTRHLAILGPVVALELEAIACERDLGLTADALDRLDRLAAAAQRPERWLIMRGDLLAAFGACDDAGRAYDDAIEAIRQLPTRHRMTATTQRLDLQARRGLAMVHADAPEPLRETLP